MTDVHLCVVPWTTNITPGGFDEQQFQKDGLKGVLVVVDGSSFAQGQRSLDGFDKRLWRLETMVMASTLCRHRSLSGVHELALLTAVSFEMPANHNLIRVNG